MTLRWAQIDSDDPRTPRISSNGIWMFDTLMRTWQQLHPDSQQQDQCAGEFTLARIDQYRLGVGGTSSCSGRSSDQLPCPRCAFSTSVPLNSRTNRGGGGR